MFRLGTELPFGMGTHRAVYLHPEREDRCIKVMKGDWHDGPRWQRANRLARICRPKAYFHENLRELGFSRELCGRLGEAAWQFVPQAHGLVDTDLGEGLEVDLVRDHDGKLSATLGDVLWDEGMTDPVRAAIDAFWEGMEQHRIFAHGRVDNVALVRNADGTCRCVAIDGFGLPQFPPLARWFGPLARKQFCKVRTKQAAKIAALLARRADGGPAPRKGCRL